MLNNIMPERVYIDMGGGQQVPPETWAGATIENVTDALIQSSDHPHPETLSLRGLLASVVVPDLTDEARALLNELAPDAIAHREAQLEEQRRNRNG
jgi:hypothetical protein